MSCSLAGRSSQEIDALDLSDTFLHMSAPFTESLNDNDHCSLAKACTNKKPTLKDIFGDFEVKEELQDSHIDNGLSVSDFSQELLVASSAKTALWLESRRQKGLYHPVTSSSFEGLIKDEPVDDDVDSRNNDLCRTPEPTNTSIGAGCDRTCDSSVFGASDDGSVPNASPLQDPQSISDSESSDSSNIRVTGIRVISPLKIKLFLSSKQHTGKSFLRPRKIKREKECLINEGETDTAEESEMCITAVSQLEKSDDDLIDSKIFSLPRTCVFCRTEFKKFTDLQKHVELHQNEGIIACTFCQKTFSDKTSMKRHTRVHTGERPYECKICGKRFSLPGNFKKHRDIHDDVRSEPCKICNKTFRRREHLRHHMRTHTGEKPFRCNVCGSRFTARYSLHIHMNIHLGKKPYKCNYCSKCFADKSTMRKHIRIHTGERPFKCADCGKAFAETGTLAAHTATHSVDRPFSCTRCDLSFKTVGGLRQHEKVHVGNKQFTCRFCNMRFLQKYNMQTHERIHTGEKPFPCSECGKKFRSTSCLGKHKVLHASVDSRKFGCSHCDKKFYRKCHLKRHIDMHMGIKGFHCESCARSFCTKLSLRKHFSTFHTKGARHFPCVRCNKVFKRKVYLRTHNCNGALIKQEELCDDPDTLSFDSDLVKDEHDAIEDYPEYESSPE